MGAARAGAVEGRRARAEARRTRAEARRTRAEARRAPTPSGALAGGLLGLLAATPLAVLLAAGFGPLELASASARGLVAEVDSVGFVLVPQLVLAVGILGLALQQTVRRAARLPRLAPPGWLSPAVESALLLGLLGTISGMVAGFVGVSPEELEPAPLVRGLGAALRSTFVGFAIALVGVWLKDEGPTLGDLAAAAGDANGPRAGDANGPRAGDANGPRAGDASGPSASDAKRFGEGSPVPPHHPPRSGRPGGRP